MQKLNYFSKVLLFASPDQALERLLLGAHPLQQLTDKSDILATEGLCQVLISNNKLDLVHQ